MQFRREAQERDRRSEQQRLSQWTPTPAQASTAPSGGVACAPKQGPVGPPKQHAAPLHGQGPQEPTASAHDGMTSMPNFDTDAAGDQMN